MAAQFHQTVSAQHSRQIVNVIFCQLQSNRSTLICNEIELQSITTECISELIRICPDVHVLLPNHPRFFSCPTVLVQFTTSIVILENTVFMILSSFQQKLKIRTLCALVFHPVFSWLLLLMESVLPYFFYFEFHENSYHKQALRTH